MYVVTFNGEPGVDTGGIRREYFTLLLKHINDDTSLVEGSYGHKLPVQSVNKLISGEYELVGKIIGASILQGGPSPTFFAQSVLEYWLCGLSGMNTNIEDIPGQYQHEVQKVNYCTIVLVVQI